MTIQDHLEDKGTSLSILDAKENVYQVEAARATGLSAEDDEFLRNFSDEKKAKVLRKIDFRLVPLLTLFYMVSYIDRANIGNAKIEGLVEDLNLTDSDYNTCLSVFFIPYVLGEMPSNYILARVKRPSIWMACIITVWGIVMTMAGLCKNFSHLLAVRFFLGLAEAGFFPGAVFIVSNWYLPNETQKRIALFYTASALSGAFSGLLAAGIAQMDGIGGQAGWSWIFYLEGIFTVFCGIACWWLLIDNPDASSKWLEPDEIRYLNLRQIADPSRRAGSEKRENINTWKIVRSVFADWQLYLQALVFWGNSVPNNALKFTMPQIVKNMGFKSTHAQLLTVPPYVAGAISAYLSAIFADRMSWRMPFLVGPLATVAVAYAVLFGKAGSENNTGVMYFGVVLACIGLYPINPCNSAWALSNLAGPSKRAMGVGYYLALGNAGGVAGSYIFIDSQKPTYPIGFGVSLAFAVLAILACVVLEILYKLINHRRAQMSEEEVRAKYSDDELDTLGDRSPLFRYSY